MKKIIFPILTLLAVFALTFVSCKSSAQPKQDTTPRTTETQGTPAQSTAALNGPMARAEEARKRAMDFESPAYFPSDWERVEAQYTAAGRMPRSTSEDIQRAAAAYNASADAFDELFKKTVPLYAQAREDEIMAARDELIGTGFTDFFPQYLQKADAIAMSAQEKYEAEDYYGARDTAAQALNEYETLMLGARVFLTRQEIIDRGFKNYDSDNFDLADEVAQTAIEEYDAGNKEAAVNNAQEALLRYNIVLKGAWISYATTRRAATVSERDLALKDKANVAARETFRQAETLYNQAEEDLAAEKYSSAAVLYIDAEAIYNISRQETEEKRIRAEEAIRLAEEKIESSNETAIEAERIIEGGSR